VHLNPSKQKKKRGFMQLQFNLLNAVFSISENLAGISIDAKTVHT